MTTKKSLVFLILCILTAVIVLSAGCIETSNNDMSNTLVYAGDPAYTINPILNTHSEIVTLLFNGLIKYDGNANPVVDITESYTYDAESKTYTFNLKKGVTWHDGEMFTADDVKFTYDILMYDDTVTTAVKSNYHDIESVIAKDNYTIIIKMKNDNAGMLGYFTVGILPEHLLKGKNINTDSFNQNPVGTGKYRFVEWDTAGGMIVLERNPDYFGKIPNIDRIIYKTVSVESTKATMLLTGEADLALLNSNHAKAFRGNSNYKNIDFKTADYRAMSMDFKTEFWQRNSDSIAVLNYALDKDAIVEGVLDGRGVTAFSPMQLNEYGGNPAADIYRYDLQKFHYEMKRLGWKKGDDGIYERNGEKFHFTMQVREHEEERIDIANICARMLKEQGVVMEIIVVTKFDWDAGYNGFLSGYATEFDPDVMYSSYVTGGSDNMMQYSNEKVDRLLEKARHETNPEKRKAIYWEFEEAYSETPGIVVVAYLDGNYVSIAGLNGLNTTRVLGHHAVGVMWNIEEWKLSK